MYQPASAVEADSEDPEKEATPTSEGSKEGDESDNSESDNEEEEMDEEQKYEAKLFDGMTEESRTMLKVGMVNCWWVWFTDL